MMVNNDGVTVTVVVPLYNQSRFLAQAIASLQNQTLEDWECIVVDDGSTDDARRIIEKLAARDGRITYLRQENAGPSAARNRGVAAARGWCIQFLDADDLLENGKLAAHVEYLARHPSVGIVYGDVRYFTDAEPQRHFFGVWGELKPWVGELAASPEPMLTKVLSRNIMAMNCPVLRRSVFERVGRFREDIRGCEDWEFWIRCAAGGECFNYVAESKTLALVRSHPGSSSRDLIRMLEGECRFRVSLGPILKEPRLRLENFEKGANRLRELNPPSYRRRLLELAKAHGGALVYCYTFLRFLDRGDRLRSIARRWRSRTRHDSLPLAD